MDGDITVTFQHLKGACKEARGNFLRDCSDRTRNYGLKLKEGEFRLHIWKKVFYYEGDEISKQVAQRIWG